MPINADPLSVHARRVARIERDLRAQRRMIRAFTSGAAAGITMFLSGVAVGVWSGLHHWDGGAPASALVMTGVVFTVFTIIGGLAWWDISADHHLQDQLDDAHDDYDRAVERTVHDAR